jgi:hypothetical protein
MIKQSATRGGWRPAKTATICTHCYAADIRN